MDFIEEGLHGGRASWRKNLTAGISSRDFTARTDSRGDHEHFIDEGLHEVTGVTRMSDRAASESKFGNIASESTKGCLSSIVVTEFLFFHRNSMTCQKSA